MYTATIGIECHVQLKSVTKLFTPVNNDAREASPNSLISPLCVGLPGTLPVVNGHAVALAVRAGYALGAEIAHYSKFDRKHYFYPDLPLGYQITQFDEPIILAGGVSAIRADGSAFRVRIHHAHLEADAGKSTHPTGRAYSLVDLNRAGTPLLEIVSEPDMHTPEEAKAYARELYLLMKYADVTEADLFYGNMRFDVNVSVSKDNTLGTRTETKNLNSFRSVEKAVEYEIDRQIRELEAGNTIHQETRGWDDAKQKTISQRSKENAHDYRYFPDPDLPPIRLTDPEIKAVCSQVGRLPAQLRESFSVLGSDIKQTEALLEEPEVALALADVIDAHGTTTARMIVNWFSGEITRCVSEGLFSWQDAIDRIPALLELVSMVEGSMVSTTVAKDLLRELIASDQSPERLANDKGLIQVSDLAELEVIVQQVINENEKAASDVRAGEMKAIGYLVGQVMKASGGKANPGVVQKLLAELLK